MSAPVMSKAGRYGVSCATAARRLDDHERVLRVERLQPPGGAHEPSGRIQSWPRKVARLVALVGAQAGVVLNVAVTCDSSCSRVEAWVPAPAAAGRGARRGRASSGAAGRAASSTARSAASCSSILPGSPLPVRMNVAPASAISFRPVTPFGAVPPSGAGWRARAGTPSRRRSAARPWLVDRDAAHGDSLADPAP